jgi:serine/threonine protein kinase/formylglycine-generating enzyme required for sulfatase activity
MTRFASTTRREAVISEFEAAWLSGRRPRIDDFLAGGGTLDLTLLAELAHIDLECRLKAGEPARVEKYISAWPVLVERHKVVLELIEAECELRRRSDTAMAIDEYCRRFPQYASELPLRLSTLRDRDLAEGTSATRVTASPADQSLVSTLPPPPAAWGRLASWTRPAKRYRRIRFHAKGGIGEVHLAEDGELRREVALKRIQGQFSDDPECRRRFLLEAEITARLQHPGIVPIYGLVDDERGRPSYAMRFIEGVSLKDAIDAFHRADAAGLDEGRRSAALRKLLNRFVAACDAVEYAHSRGVIHRDLKPANIMLGQYGETLVIDWGLAKVLSPPARGTAPLRASNEAQPRLLLLPPTMVDDNATQSGQIVGTPHYMSPEQAAGKQELVGTASDVYGLGATLYTLLTGKPPIVGRSQDDVIDRARRGMLAPLRQSNAKAPAALGAVAVKAMALRQEYRYDSARALADDIERWMNDQPVSAYREPLLRRFARWRRNHKTLVGATTAAAAVMVLAVLLGLTLGRQANDRARAVEMADGLLKADIAEVPAIVEQLAPFHEIVRERLATVCATAAPDSPRRLHAALALLDHDAGQIGYLRDQLPALKPAQFPVVRDALLGHATTIVESLWRIATDANDEPSRRFQVACALATYTPDDDRWKQVDTFVAGRLVTLEASDLVAWRTALYPAAKRLIGPLGTVFRNTSEREKARTYAAETLAEFHAGAPDKLFDLLADAEPFQFSILYNKLKEHNSQAIKLGGAELTIRPAETAAENQKERLGKRQANVAVALLKLGAEQTVWPLLRESSDPRARSYLIHWFGALGGDPRTITDRLDQEPDASIRRAIVLMLGEIGEAQMARFDRAPLVEKLLTIYESEPDSGLHAAAEWLLRKWGQSERIAAVVDRLRANEGRLWAGGAAEGRHWYVNTEGQTFVVLDAVEFTMGSPESEPQRLPEEIRHRRKLGRRFALGAHEVTKAQFAAFQHDRPTTGRPNISQYAPTDDSPVVWTDWHEAAAYCNWLSEKEGIPSAQWCYEPNEYGECASAMKAKNDAEWMTGYRLPSAAEWECGCRAGTATIRFYGASDVLLAKYAWFLDNSGRHGWPVGMTKPNDFGLFDMLGNANEWCHDSPLNYLCIRDGSIDPIAVELDPQAEMRNALREQRGATFDADARFVRSAGRCAADPSSRLFFFGFRVARTYP